MVSRGNINFWEEKFPGAMLITHQTAPNVYTLERCFREREILWITRRNYHTIITVYYTVNSGRDPAPFTLLDTNVNFYTSSLQGIMTYWLLPLLKYASQWIAHWAEPQRNSTTCACSSTADKQGTVSRVTFTFHTDEVRSKKWTKLNVEKNKHEILTTNQFNPFNLFLSIQIFV